MHGPVPLPGDLVWIRRRRWRVERVRRDRHVVCLDVAARDRRLTFLSPFDRVFTVAGAPTTRRVRPQEATARLAHLIASCGDIRVPSALVSARADILPFQIEPAMAMLAGQPRILLADEVGLGKTIQAGLIVAELRQRDPAVRIVVLTPASLRDQWQDELLQRFGVACLVADRAGLDAIARAGAYGDSPWQQPGVWIASADFLKQRHVADAMPRLSWDLLVVDEAHAACGDSDRYKLVHELACRSRRVLLLTATPHGGDQIRFDRLLDIGRIGASHAATRPDADRPIMFRRTRDSLGFRPTRRVRWHQVTLSAAESEVLAALRAFEIAVLKRAATNEQALLLLSVFRKRALSTMTALSQSVTRRLAWIGDLGPEASVEWAQPRLGFDEDAEEAEQEERQGLTAHLELPGRQERSWLRRLRTLADAAAREESKIRRLIGLIRRSAEPVVVFTEFRDSLDAVRRRLPFDRPASILHGGQDAAERRQQLKLFLDGTTSVLLATDVAGQGLNLQSRARWVVSLELPWNPTRLEQRIGRVDRISQMRPTHFTLLLARDEAESGLLAHLSRRILTARRSIGHDVLAGVAPPEEAVRRALLFRSPLALADSAPVPLPSCRHWQRLARRAAMQIGHRRELAAKWKAPSGHSSCGAIFCDHPRAAQMVPLQCRSLLVFSVPVLDATDVLIARLLVAVGSTQPVCGPRHCRALTDALKHRIAAAGRRRVARIARNVRIAAGTTMDRDRRIAEAAAREVEAEELQPGLFDQREVRAFEQNHGEFADAQSAAARALGQWELRRQIRTGDPVLEIALSRR